MSDFFSSLVARSFGTAPVIRPRLSSLFEPARGDAKRVGETLGERNDDKIEVQEGEVIARQPENQEPARRTPTLPGDGEHTTSRSTDHVVASAIPEHSTQLVAEPERHTVSEKLIERHETRILLGEVRQLDDANKTAPRIAMTQSPGPISNKPWVPDTANFPALVGPVEDARPGRLISPKVPAEMRIPDLALSAKAVRRHNGEPSFPRKESQPSEPTVQVTIGRIEVRATKENTHPSRPASASPVMSLDEYLRKQSQRAQ